MPTSTFFGVPIVTLSKIHNVFIDAVEEVTVTHDTMVTRHPTETGRNVSDHVVNLPVSIRMSGRFSDAPLSTGGISVFNPFQAITTAIASGLTGGLSVSNWVKLEELRRSKIPFDVVIQQGVYLNMVLKSLTSPRGKGDGRSLRFQAEMLEIVTVEESPLGTSSNYADDTRHTGPESNNLGVQPTQLVA